MTGAAVYRIPVDDTALVFQVGQPAERPADPERAARIGRVQQALREALGRSEGGRISLEDSGLSAEEYARYQADVAEASRPLVNVPARPPAGGGMLALAGRHLPAKPRRRHRAVPGGPLPPSRRRAYDQALAAHHAAVNQLRDWGRYGRAAELCRETLTWRTPTGGRLP